MASVRQRKRDLAALIKKEYERPVHLTVLGGLRRSRTDLAAMRQPHHDHSAHRRTCWLTSARGVYATDLLGATDGDRIPQAPFKTRPASNSTRGLPRGQGAPVDKRTQRVEIDERRSQNLQAYRLHRAGKSHL